MSCNQTCNERQVLGARAIGNGNSEKAHFADRDRIRELEKKVEQLEKRPHHNKSK